MRTSLPCPNHVIVLRFRTEEEMQAFMADMETAKGATIRGPEGGE